MKRGFFGQRFPRWHADEFARFINAHGLTIMHQKKDGDTQCTECWDYGSYAPNCTVCGGSGYQITVKRKKGYVAFTQPYGNFGNAAQTFKAGGMHERMSAYVYMDERSGKDVDAGDRLVVNFNNGYRQELVVMNSQPQLASSGVIIGYVYETASPINKNLEEIRG
jgi:hypothetical protein